MAVSTSDRELKLGAHLRNVPVPQHVHPKAASLGFDPCPESYYTSTNNYASAGPNNHICASPSSKFTNTSPNGACNNDKSTISTSNSNSTCTRGQNKLGRPRNGVRRHSADSIEAVGPNSIVSSEGTGARGSVLSHGPGSPSSSVRLLRQDTPASKVLHGQGKEKGQVSGQQSQTSLLPPQPRHRPSRSTTSLPNRSSLFSLPPPSPSSSTFQAHTAKTPPSAHPPVSPASRTLSSWQSAPENWSQQLSPATTSPSAQSPGKTPCLSSARKIQVSPGSQRSGLHPNKCVTLRSRSASARQGTLANSQRCCSELEKREGSGLSVLVSCPRGIPGERVQLRDSKRVQPPSVSVEIALNSPLPLSVHSARDNRGEFSAPHKAPRGFKSASLDWDYRARTGECYRSQQGTQLLQHAKQVGALFPQNSPTSPERKQHGSQHMGPHRELDWVGRWAGTNVGSTQCYDGLMFKSQETEGADLEENPVRDRLLEWSRSLTRGGAKSMSEVNFERSFA